MKICIYILTSRKNSERQCSDDLCVQITYEVIFFLLPLELYFVTSLMVDIKKKKKKGSIVSLKRRLVFYSAEILLRV